MPRDTPRKIRGRVDRYSLLVRNFHSLLSAGLSRRFPDIKSTVCATRELSAKTLKGKLINTMPMTHRRESASSLETSNSLLGSRNSGKATLELTSFSGNIRIHPQY